MVKEKENTKKSFDRSRRLILDLKEFILLDGKKQYVKIESMLNEMYENSIEVTKKHVEKVLNISFDVGDNEIYLPYNLKVEKNSSKLIFSFVDKKNNWFLVILFLLGFLFIGGAATYSGFYYMNLQNFNIDLDGDGVADLNIDINEDNVCDINCDTDKDNKPNENIDYKGNRKPIFNVLKENGEIFNPINQDTNNDGKCDLNCDTDGDGWPDINIDLDGDGVPDLEIDTNGDRIPDVNIDNNGDGVCDINCDENNDGICDYNCVKNDNPPKELNVDLDGDNSCDVNCDTDDDKKPNTNIDYNGNKKPTFNVEDENGYISNPTNQDLNNDGKCDLNCDTDGDGWPDTNIDLDGDKKADINIDTNKDGNPDLNIDNNGDGKCDINCDDDGDGICDSLCAYVVIGGGSGIYQEGQGQAGISSASLIVIFHEQNAVSTTNLFPDDQEGEGVNTKVPDLKFTIKNESSQTLYYNLKWLVNKNTFTSTNFWYKVHSDKGGYTHGWTTAPFKDEVFATHVAIKPETTQTYTVSMTLHGTGEEQNYDQNKNFDGKIEVILEDR